GALVALTLAYLAALGTADRDRRDLALLRARGASRRSLLYIAAVESAALGLLAGALGTGGALLAVRLVGSAGANGTARVLVAFAEACSPGSQHGLVAAARAPGAAFCLRAPDAAARRSTAACSSPDCCSPSASTSGSSPRRTTSRHGSTHS